MVGKKLNYCWWKVGGRINLTKARDILQRLPVLGGQFRNIREAGRLNEHCEKQVKTDVFHGLNFISVRIFCPQESIFLHCAFLF
jgi:hypothetical protein